MSHTIYVCDAQPIILEGLYRVLEQYGDFQIIGNASALTEALPSLASLHPDIVLLGQSNPPRPLLPQLPHILAETPNSRVVLWVIETAEQETFRALHNGARAVISKLAGIGSLIDCLRTVAAGGVWIDDSHSQASGLLTINSMVRITPREREIIDLICQGLKNREIAEILRITPGTVKVHLMHIFEKTGTKDRFQLALRARQSSPAPNQDIPPSVGTIANSI